MWQELVITQQPLVLLARLEGVHNILQYKVLPWAGTMTGMLLELDAPERAELFSDGTKLNSKAIEGYTL